MKPHEETWILSEPFQLYLSTPDDDPIATFNGVDVEQDEARAKLAAQAPAMARELLRLLKWSQDEDGDFHLPEGLPYEDRLTNVLRDAGVIP